MKIAIVEPNDCHFELFPTWSYLLRGHDLHYWVTKRAHKMGAFSLLESPPDNIFNSTRFPLYSAIDRWRFNTQSYDAVIINTERCYKKRSEMKEIIKKINCPLILINNHCPISEPLNDDRVIPFSVSPNFGDNHISHVYFNTDEGFCHEYGKYFVVPGTVASGRRHYELLPAILDALPPNVKIMILGRVKKKVAHLIHPFRNHPKVIINERDLEFYPFVHLVKSSLGILALIEPDMPSYHKYITKTQSGNLNLSLALGVPIISNEQYIRHLPACYDSGLNYNPDYSNLTEVLNKALQYDNRQLISNRNESLRTSQTLLNKLLLAQ